MGFNLDSFFFDGSRKFNENFFDTVGEKIISNKESVVEKNKENLLNIQDLQNRLYSEGKEALLIIFQAMDAGGKDGAIKHVMSGVNPQGIDVHNFKKPTSNELAHDYLWRAIIDLPKRGKIGIFNRSYYEDVLIAKVHKLYEKQSLPDRCKKQNIIKQRYEQISNFEKYLWQNGTRIVKIFLNISKEEQRKRFLKRIDDKNKNWKLSEADIQERQYWDKYMKAYEDAINKTSTEYAPWYVVPADRKWFARYVVSEIILYTLKDMNPKFPVFPKDKLDMLSKCKEILCK